SYKGQVVGNLVVNSSLTNQSKKYSADLGFSRKSSLNPRGGGTRYGPNKQDQHGFQSFHFSISFFSSPPIQSRIGEGVVGATIAGAGAGAEVGAGGDVHHA
ncbi:hypothetical protein KJ664_00220, partial [Patescibacteria group bacterium]|nr:hypothetical protein [Patescibacteria group bacterium]